MLRRTALVWVGMSVAFGQGRGGADWTTAGNDAQRSSWVRADPKISAGALEKPGFALAWKVQLESDVSPAVLLDRYIGYRGFRSLAFVATNDGEIVALDTDLGRIEWQKHLAASPRTAGCSGAKAAGLARPTGTGFPMSGGGRAGYGGRGGPARSGVGEPGEGAVTIAASSRPRGGAAFGPPRGPARRPGGFVRMPSVVYGLSGDGMLHTMYVSNGEEPTPPVAFLPANADARGLIVVDGVAYVATTGACGTPGAVWALDLASKRVVSWQAGGGIAGSAGPAFGPDGTLYVATGAGDLAALEPKTLKVKHTYRSGSEFTSSPVLFPYKDQVLAAAATKDGRIHLLDTGSLTGSAAPRGDKTAAPSTLAAWQDNDGTPWLVAQSGGSIEAWKLLPRNGTAGLEPGWARSLVSSLPPLIVNGVLFVATAGDERSGRSVLYAWDARTGKDLWNSGTTVASFVRGGGLSAGGSQVYVGTHDGTFYAFGFPIEH